MPNGPVAGRWLVSVARRLGGGRRIEDLFEAAGGCFFVTSPSVWNSLVLPYARATGS